MNSSNATAADVVAHGGTNTVRRPRVHSTRPGTPMIGPYSVNQMDDLWADLGQAWVKPTGVMNLIQKLIITRASHAGARVLDVCCGRGLQLLPLLRSRTDLGGYVGLDISADNLAQARAMLRAATVEAGVPPFSVDLVEHDVAEPFPVGGFDVAVYTSALEHLPRELGLASLAHTAAALNPGGRLFLSTPNTPGEQPKLLQHGVHVYEWCDQELREVLPQVGLQVLTAIGILAPDDPVVLEDAVRAEYGPGAVKWLGRLRQVLPPEVLEQVAAAGFPAAAAETLYVCAPLPAARSRGRQR